MRKVLCGLCVALCLHGGALGAAELQEDSLRTEEALRQQLHAMLGKSDHRVIETFRAVLPGARARTRSIDCLPDGGKTTTVVWKRGYKRRSAIPKIETYGSQLSGYKTQRLYEVKETVQTCTVHFASRDERILSFTLEGECTW